MFSRLTTTVSASLATVKARHEPTLFDLHTAASRSRIGRDASERSISPRQKRSKPPPVPEIPTVMLTLPAPALRKSSAAAVVYGPTVDDPSAVIVPESRDSEAFVSDGAFAAAANRRERADERHDRDRHEGAAQPGCVLHLFPFSRLRVLGARLPSCGAPVGMRVVKRR